MKRKLLYSCLLVAGTMGSVFAQDTPDPTISQGISFNKFFPATPIQSSFKP